MTRRTLRRATQIVVAATALSALVAGPAAALAPGEAAPGRSGSASSQKFGGFPSWSQKAAEAREVVARTPGRSGRKGPSAAGGDNRRAGGAATRVTAKAAPQGDGGPDAVRWSEGHAGGRDMALALTAAGIPFGSNVDRGDLVTAGHQLGVTFGPRIDSGEIERVRELAWAQGGLRMTASGLDFEGRLDAHDIRLRAEDLGIDVGTQVDPGDVAAVLAAGQQGIVELLGRGGFPYDGAPSTDDLRTAARLHGVKVGEDLRPADTREIARTVAERGDPDRTLLFAKIGNVDFHLPGRRPEYVGFHQASNPSVLPFTRWGAPLSEFLASRSRGTHRAGAVDIPMPPGDEVYAPVSGRVVETKRYALYGKYTDEMLRIVPDGDTRMLTTVLHVENMRVKPGDRIVAGQTVIADGARKFPFWSQVDGYSGRPWGHVHIETRWR